MRGHQPDRILDSFLVIGYPPSLVMASNTKKTEARRKRHHKNMGRKRKNAQALKSTPSAEELFANCGVPGQPAKKSS